MKSRLEYLLVAYLPYDQRLGFGLPLFVDPRAPTRRLAQQIDEIDGRIVSFLELEGNPSEEISVQGAYTAKIGDEIVLAFFTEDRSEYFGNIKTLTPVLRSFAKNNPNEHAVRLQIFELIGSPQEKLDARLRMRSTLLQTAGGHSTAAFYDGSVLRSALWNNLLHLAPTQESAKRIIQYRSRLKAYVDEAGTLLFDLDALPVEDLYWIDVEGLRNRILQEFSVSDQQFPDGDDVNNNFDAPVEEARVSELVRRAKTAGRQEERIAILLDGFLTDPTVGMTALVRYGRDRASYGNWAIERFRQELSSEGDREMKVASLINLLFSTHYTLSRGELLLYLAKHLSKWPCVNNAIRNILYRTKSVMIEPLRPSIVDYLDNPEMGRAEPSDLFEQPSLFDIIGE